MNGAFIPPFTDKSRLFRLLTNAVYAGKVAFKGEMLEGEHEAIIHESDWQRARDLLDHNGRNGGADVRNRYGALLKGLVRCAACDAPITHAYTRKGNKLYRYYVCSKAQERGWKTCSTRSVPAGEIERVVVARIREVGKNPATVEGTLATLSEARAAAIKALREEASRVKGDLQRLQNEKRSLIIAAANDEVTGSALAEKLKSLQERLGGVERRQTEVNEQLIALERAAISKSDLRAALSLFDPVWDQLFPREQCRIMRLLVERVDYDGSRGAVDVFFCDSGIKALAEEVTERG